MKNKIIRIKNGERKNERTKERTKKDSPVHPVVKRVLIY